MTDSTMKPTLILLALTPLVQAGFRPQTIDDKVTIGYGVTVADVDGDGKPDILLVDSDQTVWYQNPTWKKHILTEKLTRRDHVCLCAKDIDGDGKAEIAVGADWAPADTKTSGAVFILTPGSDHTQPWTHKPLHHEPTTHRMHWVRETPATHFLAVLPLHGCDNINGEGPGIKFLGYRPETDPAKDWQTFLIHEGFHMAHNFDPVLWEKSHTAESILVACKEGTHLLRQTGGKWNATPLTEKPSGEVRLGTGTDGKRFIATIEPMHGNEVVLNPENTEGKLWSENRILLDDTLNQGHSLAVGDFLGLGHDQIAAGWRNPSTDTKTVGIKLYAPGEDGTWKFHSHIDDNTMACEDIKAADLDGDGKPELIASGRSTKNLIIYWNRN